MTSREERVRGGLWGLLVGDALGVPYEFHPPEAIPAAESIWFAPPTGFRRAHAGVPPGTWSDDGAHALCLLASLLQCERLDPDDLAERLSAWYSQGYMAVDGEVFDVGVQTGVALRAHRSGTPALECGPAETRDNGNGALMRVLPLAMWHQGSDEDLIADAFQQSRVTHGHARSKLCCALYCMWARRVLRGDDLVSAWTAAVVAVRSTIAVGSAEQAELEFQIRPDDPPEGDGSGYVVDSLRSARMVLVAGERSDYSSVVRAAIGLGHDTDTTACIAGGIAGLYWGIGGIPTSWRSQLRAVATFEPLLNTLVQKVERGNPSR